MSASPSSAAAKVEALEVYVPLNKLEEGVLSTVKVMVCRKWDSLNSYGKYLSTEYILSDCEALLHFMYWDDLPDMQEFSGLSSNGSFTIMAQHLLAASDRYGLDRLRLLCEARLCEDVAINTVATTLALAEQHHCFQLKAVCLKFIASRKNLKAVMQTEGFNYLKESCPTVLTELLECVAKISEHSIPVLGYGDECMLDGSDVNGRRVKQRFF